MKVAIISKPYLIDRYSIIENHFKTVDKYSKFNKEIISKYDIFFIDFKYIDIYRILKKAKKEVFVILNKASNKKIKQLIANNVEHYLVYPIEKSQIKYIDLIINNSKFIDKLIDQNFILNEYRNRLNSELIVSKTDKHGIITYVNNNFCKISEYSKKEVIGKSHNIVRHPDNPKSLYRDLWFRIKKEKKNWQGIIKNRSKSGRNYFTYSIIIPILDIDNQIKEYVSIRYDITDIMNQSKQLHITIKDMENPILIFIKLENIDIIEEYYDNDITEKFQEEVLHFLHKKFNDICQIEKVYQLNHGEFALTTENRYGCFNNETITKIKKLQNELLSETIEVDSLKFNIPILISLVYEKEKMIESAKIGIKKLIQKKENFIIANKLAEKKFQESKNNIEIITSLSDALKSDNITVFLQPIVDNRVGKIAKYEALVRMIDNNGNIVPPYMFLELSKKSSYYSQITKKVMELSIDHIKKYNIEVSINLSVLDIECQASRNYILDVLEENRSIADKITFELLEDENITDFKLVSYFIQTVKKYGVKIAIDDFGSGYSNFEKLMHYQPDILKIDGSLIKNILNDNFVLSIVKSIIAFAKEHNIETIAEFIENEQLYNSVKLLGIDYSQGYLFGKPEKFDINKINRNYLL